MLPRGRNPPVRRLVEAPLVSRGDQHGDPDAVDRRRPKLPLGGGPVEGFPVGDRGPQAIEARFVLGPEIAQQRVDQRGFQVRLERVEQHDGPRIGSMVGGEDAGVGTAERMADQDERRSFAGRVEQPAKVGSGLGQRPPAAWVAGAEPGPIVGAGPGRGRDLVEHRAPRAGTAARSRLEHDGRGTLAPTVEIEGALADRDPFAPREVWRRQAVARQPQSRTANAKDIDGDGQQQTSHHGEREPHETLARS